MLRTLVSERERGQFNAPKNLAAVLSVQAAELLEPLQWLSTGDGNELIDCARGGAPRDGGRAGIPTHAGEGRMNVDLCVSHCKASPTCLVNELTPSLTFAEEVADLLGGVEGAKKQIMQQSTVHLAHFLELFRRKMEQFSQLS